MNKIIGFIIAVISLTSCTEIINVDLDTTDQQVVIGAIVDGNSGTCTVLLSKSGGFYTTSNFDKISNANVNLKDEEGVVYPLSEVNAGKYVSDTLTVVPGKKYTISIENVEGKKYSATAIAPIPPKLKDVIKSEFVFSSDTIQQYLLNGIWLDHAGTADNYRAKLYIDGVFQAKDYGLIDDEFFDGEIIEGQLETIFEEGQNVKVALVSMDRGSYEYFVQLSENEEKTYNPKSNFGAGVLGYFSIQFSDTVEIKI